MTLRMNIDYFSSELVYIVPVAQIDSKNILSRTRPDCRIALTSPERAWFSAYSALYLKESIWYE